MLGRIRLLIGISIFWLALSMLTDGVNTLILPLQLSRIASQGSQATALGLLTFFGLLAGALVQPVMGAFSDRLQPLLGRNRFIGIGLILSLVSLFIFATFPSLAGMVVGYLAIQVSASIAQAGQQALIPDLVPAQQRGVASGFKGFSDMAGAMVGFAVLGQLLGSQTPGVAVGVLAAVLVAAYFIALLLTPEDRPARVSKAKPITMPLREIFHLDSARDAGFIRLVASRFLFLLGIYAVGRFLLLFVAERLGLLPEQAAEQAGTLLAGLALITILASPVAGWLADRIGRLPLMVVGAALGATGTLALVWAWSAGQILLFGGLMSLGSAAFTGGSWALLADLVPKDQSARFFGLANFSVAGSAAAAGLFGPVVDGVERFFPGMGFSVLFVMATLAFLASVLPLKGASWKEVGVKNGNQRKVRPDAAGLALVSLPADPAVPEEDQDPQGGAAPL